MSETELEMGELAATIKGERWTVKKRKFCYHAARNGGDFRKAAKDAGYKQEEYGYELWKKPEIRREIEKELLACLQKEGENSETIIARWSNWINANIYDYFKMDQDGIFTLRDPKDLTEEQKLRVKKITTSVNQYGQNVSVELHDAAKAQDRLAEILGLINSQNVSTNPAETAEAIRDLIGQMQDVSIGEPPASRTLN